MPPRSEVLLPTAGAAGLGGLVGVSWATLHGRPLLSTGFSVAGHTSVIAGAFFCARSFFQGERCQFPEAQSSVLAGGATGWLVGAIRGPRSSIPGYVAALAAGGLGFQLVAWGAESAVISTASERQKGAAAEPKRSTIRAASKEEEEAINRRWWEIIRRH